MFTKLLNRYVWNPYALDGEALEDTWIDSKVELLVTCPSKNELAYSSLYKRCNELLRVIASRHKHLLLDAEANSPLFYYIGGAVLRQISIGNPDRIPMSILPGLILLSFSGGSTATTAGAVEPNPRFVIEATDYLIDEKKHPIGLFLKGLVLKYGIQLFLPPNINAAEEFFKAAKANGIGSAAIELDYLYLHKSRLCKPTSIHIDFNGIQQWVEQARVPAWP